MKGNCVDWNRASVCVSRTDETSWDDPALEEDTVLAIGQVVLESRRCSLVVVVDDGRRAAHAFWSILNGLRSTLVRSVATTFSTASRKEACKCLRRVAVLTGPTNRSPGLMSR
jgi:hypothetical protein